MRESNANCRTHWAWITRTHLAAKTQSRLNLLQSCLYNIKFICLSNNKEMNCWQVQWNLFRFDLACKTYLTYMIFYRISCIRVNTKLYTTHTHIRWFVSVVVTWEIFIISVLLTTNKDASKHVYTCMCIEDVLASSFLFTNYLSFQAEVKLEYLLNLSILISKGKEINWDCLSNGEWTGKSSLLKRVKFTFDMHCSIWGDYCMVPVRVSSFDQGFNHRRC